MGTKGGALRRATPQSWWWRLVWELIPGRDLLMERVRWLVIAVIWMNQFERESKQILLLWGLLQPPMYATKVPIWRNVSFWQNLFWPPSPTKRRACWTLSSLKLSRISTLCLTLVFLHGAVNGLQLVRAQKAIWNGYRRWGSWTGVLDPKPRSTKLCAMSVWRALPIFLLKTICIVQAGPLLVLQRDLMMFAQSYATYLLSTSLKMKGKLLMKGSIAEIFFHNTKQGVFRYFVASCVMLMLKLRYYDDPDGSNRRDVVLDRAYNHFKWFCSTTGRSPALRSFSLSFINSPNWFTFPWVNCQGSATSHLLAWVHTMLVGFMNDPLKQDHMAVLEQMIAAAGAARTFQRICYSHNLWLTKFCAGSMYKHLHAFVAHYNGAAFLAMNQFQYTGFAFTSKYHLLCHQKLETLRLLEDETVEWVPNPQFFGCEMNEDVVGRLSRLIRRVNARRASSRALHLYLIKSKAVYQRFKVKQAKLKVKPGRWDLGGPTFSHPRAPGKSAPHRRWPREDWGLFINATWVLPLQWINWLLGSMECRWMMMNV